MESSCLMLVDAIFMLMLEGCFVMKHSATRECLSDWSGFKANLSKPASTILHHYEHPVSIEAWVLEHN